VEEEEYDEDECHKKVGRFEELIVPVSERKLC
jgi:hypothetical protein